LLSVIVGLVVRLLVQLFVLFALGTNVYDEKIINQIGSKTYVFVLYICIVLVALWGCRKKGQSGWWSLLGFWYILVLLFERHINWSLFLGLLLSFFVGWVIKSHFDGLMLAMFGTSPSNDKAIENIGRGTYFLVSYIYAVLIALWGNRQKGQSGWWSLFGRLDILVLLFIKNKSEEKPIVGNAKPNGDAN
jgi:hypothetical protein